MKPAAYTLTACIFGMIAWKLHDLRNDHNNAEAKRQEMARKVSEKGDLTDELAGELRRLRVRVGRLEEKQTPPQP